MLSASSYSLLRQKSVFPGRIYCDLIKEQIKKLDGTQEEGGILLMAGLPPQGLRSVFKHEPCTWLGLCPGHTCTLGRPQRREWYKKNAC